MVVVFFKWRGRFSYVWFRVFRVVIVVFKILGCEWGLMRGVCVGDF